MDHKVVMELKVSLEDREPPVLLACLDPLVSLDSLKDLRYAVFSTTL